jgi:hypothetical protein
MYLEGITRPSSNTELIEIVKCNTSMSSGVVGLSRASSNQPSVGVATLICSSLEQPLNSIVVPMMVRQHLLSCTHLIAILARDETTRDTCTSVLVELLLLLPITRVNSVEQDECLIAKEKVSYCFTIIYSPSKTQHHDLL